LTVSSKPVNVDFLRFRLLDTLVLDDAFQSFSLIALCIVSQGIVHEGIVGGYRILPFKRLGKRRSLNKNGGIDIALSRVKYS